jgi:hypothetical protein
MAIKVPDHTTFSGAVSVSQPPPIHVIIDSTGWKVYGAGEWQREKHGECGRRTGRKLHLAVDPTVARFSPPS